VQIVSTPRYAVGIDLGTTNSVLAYTRLEAEQPAVELLPIPQLVAAGTIESRFLLPSFLYLANPAEASAGLGNLLGAEGRAYLVGEFARRQAAEVPTRTVAAAKSWLAHRRVDRHQAILPWQAPEDVDKVSPVTAAQRYLEHLAAAWTQAFPDDPLDQQRVVLTVPASFDASARDLTREAALIAGLPEDFLLLEEPQAAVYAWLAALSDRWRRVLKVGDTILVCDVGGGTTDFSLISVSEEAGNLELRRLAVGEHLLLGGDNMDLALAHHVAAQFATKKVHLDPWQAVALWHSCRAAKEQILSEDGPAKQPITVLGRGSRLMKNTVSVDLARAEAGDLLLAGFFPSCKLQDRPARSRTSGFLELGLPYVQDTAVTRHMAAFLTAQAEKGAAPVQPTQILFNGGVFKAPLLRQRLLEVLGTWFPQAPPRELPEARDFDHAVARGAAYYGFAKERNGVRIRGGTARSYYVGMETAGPAIPGARRPLQALCIVPFGMEEGTAISVPGREIGLIVGEPAQFRFFNSAVRKHDTPGQVLATFSEDELVETDPLEATLPAVENWSEETVPVRFESRLTELGVFELWCVSTVSDDRWKLEFSVRDQE